MGRRESTKALVGGWRARVLTLRSGHVRGRRPGGHAHYPPEELERGHKVPTRGAASLGAGTRSWVSVLARIWLWNANSRGPMLVPPPYIQHMLVNER